MNANFLAATARPLLLAAALCLAPTAQAEDSKQCNWPNGNAEGLICLVDQSTPLLPNGTTRDKPAKICSHGPGGEALYYGCHELWYDQPGGSELLPVPWKQEDFIPFLAYLDSVAGNAGEESGWCYADQPPPYKQETGREETTDDQGKPVVEVLYKCEGFAESCDAGPANECQPGEEFVVAEPPPCDPHTWSPDPSTVEKGTQFVQTNGCGTPRDAWGTKEALRWVRLEETSRNPPAWWKRLSRVPFSDAECKVAGSYGYGSSTIRWLSFNDGPIRSCGTDRVGACHKSRTIHARYVCRRSG